MHLSLTRGELFDNLGAERGQVVWSAAGHQTAVDDHLSVGPRAAGVPDVRGQGRPGGQGAAADHVGFHQGPRAVADDPGRLARLEEAADEAHRTGVTAELVRAYRAAWDEEGVVVVCGNLVEGLVDDEGLARLEVMVAGAGFAGLGADHVDVGACVLYGLFRLGELDLLTARGASSMATLRPRSGWLAMTSP